MKPNDQKLINSYLKGNNAAFNKLACRYQQQVYNLCYRLAGPSEAENLTQEIFISLTDKLPQWLGEIEFSTWLYKLALSHCLNRLGDSQAGAEYFEFDNNIFATMLKLPIDLRVTVFLRDVEGLSYAEIAEMLEIEPDTVKSRLARARVQLCALLEQNSTRGASR
jgi:RNA polymerase sigma-70 factor (ECF subfamily)